MTASEVIAGLVNSISEEAQAYVNSTVLPVHHFIISVLIFRRRLENSEIHVDMWYDEDLSKYFLRIGITLVPPDSEEAFRKAEAEVIPLQISSKLDFKYVLTGS